MKLPYDWGKKDVVLPAILGYVGYKGFGQATIWRFPKMRGYPKSSKSWMTMTLVKKPMVTWGYPMT